jgi:hypothetical protein
MNKRQTIHIDTDSGKRSLRVRVIAPGLAVHPSVAFELYPRDYDLWTVTHTTTGRFICFAPTQPKAVRIAKALSDLADWPNITMDRAMLKELGKKVRKVIKGERQEWPGKA